MLSSRTSCLTVVLLLLFPAILAAELPLEYILQWGTSGSGPGQFQYIGGVAVSQDGYVYVSDYSDARVQKFASTGAYILEFGSAGSGDGQFAGAWGLDVGVSGRVYVTDKTLNRVQVFDQNGTFIRRWGVYGPGPGQFNGLVDIAVNEAIGYAYTIEQNGRRVQRFSLDGTYLGEWGSSGSGDGQFLFPQSIAVAPNGDVLVVDQSQRRVQRFSSTGTFLEKWGDASVLTTPFGIVVDGDGDILIADDGRLRKFTAAGVLLWTRGVTYCRSIDVFRTTGTSTDHIYTNDAGNDRINYYQWYPRSEIQVTPTSLHYSGVNVGTTAYDTVNVYNTGDTTLTVSSVISDLPEFTPLLTTFDVGVGESQDVAVSFTPSAYGSFISTLWISNNDPSYPLRPVGLEGYTASPDIAVEPDTIQFGGVPFGQVGQDSIMVRNVGDATLVVSDVVVPAPFSPTPTAFSVAAGDTQWVHVTFTPDTHGPFSESLMMVNDDPDENPTYVELYGTGLAPDLRFTAFSAPTELTIADAPLNVSFTLRNTGTTDALPFSVGVYASEDSSIDAGDELIHSEPYTGLAQGDSSVASLVLTASTAVRGDVYLGVFADNAAALFEISESNNTTKSSFTFNVPTIYNVRDVPDDQGGFVYLSWYSSPLDAVPAGGLITEYTLWRAIDADGAALLIEGGKAKVVDTPVFSSKRDEIVLRKGTAAVATFFWELVDTHAAYRIPAYGKPMVTLFDSTGTDAEYHYFQVIAHTVDPLTFYITAADSGRSVDNLAPATPKNLVGEQVVEPEGLSLLWDANTESDLSHYAIYRGESPDFNPSAGNFIGTADVPTFHDPDWRWDDPKHYKISALDVHDNESPFAYAGPNVVSGIESASLPLSNYLGQNHPNPFNPVTLIEFGLKADDDVSLRIYDAAGRLVRSLLDGHRVAKHYAVHWDGTDNAGSRVASGVYFYRLETGSFTLTRKMVLLK